VTERAGDAPERRSPDRTRPGAPLVRGIARYASAEQLHALFFDGRSKKQTYRRLAKLSEPGNRPGGGACQGGRKPASGHQRTNTRDGHDTQAGEQTDNAAHGRPCAGSWASIGGFGALGLNRGIAATRLLVGHKTYLTVGVEIGPFQLGHHRHGIGVVVV